MANHVIALESLPPIHAEPFDRPIVARSLSEPVVPQTRDPFVARYNETIRIV